MSEQYTKHTDPTIEVRAEQQLAAVRERVEFDAIAGLYDRAFPLIFAALEAAGVQPVAPPVGVVHEQSGSALDLSVAVPVAAEFAGTREVRSERLPGGRVATLLVRGDYGGIAAGYERLYAWIAERGEACSGLAWEQYLTEPEPGGDPALNETLLAVHLVG